jgi:hypothetical protein
MTREFPQSKEYEDDLLTSTDLASLIAYMRPYLQSAIAKVGIDEKKQAATLKLLEGDIATAVERYLANGGLEKDYKFSSYFGWYIGERLNTPERPATK